MNKKLVFIFIAIIVLIVAIPVSLYLQTSEKKNIEPREPSEPNVKITDFSVSHHWGNPVGMLYDCWFNLTLENRGIENVSALELKVKAFLNNSEVDVGNYFIGTYENGTIKDPLGAGEVREFKGAILIVLGREPYIDISSNETSIIAMVLLNDTVLDEQPFA